MSIAQATWFRLNTKNIQCLLTFKRGYRERWCFISKFAPLVYLMIQCKWLIWLLCLHLSVLNIDIAVRNHCDLDGYKRRIDTSLLVRHRWVREWDLKTNLNGCFSNLLYIYGWLKMLIGNISKAITWFSSSWNFAHAIWEYLSSQSHFYNVIWSTYVVSLV